METVAMEALVFSLKNHFDSACVCEFAYRALSKIAEGNKKQTELLIELDCGIAVARAKKEWPNDNGVQTQVRRLAELLAAETNS
jgi:hypothetical protein